ncbi:MAG TPA: hypothetical protein VGH33_11045 [Isosphaeraceae bacterium]
MNPDAMSAALDAIHDEASKVAKILRTASPGATPPAEAGERLRLIITLALCKFDVRPLLGPAEGVRGRAARSRNARAQGAARVEASDQADRFVASESASDFGRDELGAGRGRPGRRRPERPGGQLAVPEPSCEHAVSEDRGVSHRHG